MAFECTTTAYLFQSPYQFETEVYAVDLVTGASTRAGTIDGYVNGVGYNDRDDFMYGYYKDSKQIVRIGADLALTPLGVPSNDEQRLRTDIMWSSGDVDERGHLWLLEVNGPWAEVDLTDDPPTLVDQGTATSTAGFPVDWAFIDGTLYGVVVQSVGGRYRSVLVSFDTTTHQFTDLGVLDALAGEAGGFGAAYSDGTYLYVSNNRSGNIFRVDPRTTEAFKLSGGPNSANNDGAMCHTPLATVTVVKNVGGRLVTDDQFTVALLDAAGDPVVDVTTTGTQTSVSSINQPVVRGRTYLVTDNLTDASPSLPTDYTGSLSCVSEDGPVPVPQLEIANWSLTIGDADDYVCTVTNTPDAPAPELELAKSVTALGPYDVGDVLTYSFEVTNAGNVPVSAIAVTEVSFSGAGTPSTPVCAATTLQPGTSTTCTATYTVQAADVAAGSVSNTARATGSDPGGGPVTSNDDSATVPSTPAPSLAFEKSALPSAVVQAGDTVRFEFGVTNTGNVPVAGVAVSDDAFNGTGAAISTPVCDRTTLGPGQAARCEATYTATQADVDRAAPLVNSAHATGTGPSGDPVSSPPDSASVPVISTPELTLQKSASGRPQRGADRIDYRFKVTNTGNTTVSGLDIAETAFSGTGRLRGLTCRATTLAPRASTICTAQYRVTAADVRAGFVENTATAGGRDPQAGPVASNPSSAVVGLPLVGYTPRIATRVSDRRVTPGERIHDRVRLTGLGRGTRVKATARLYGPFSSRAAARCRPAHLQRSVTWQARRGWTRTPSVRVSEPGVYTWRVSTRPTASVARATHRCGQRSETLTVAKRPYRPPAVNGGFAGTLLSPPAARGSLPRVRAKAIGLDAAVLRAGVRRGAMELPRDVGMVSWLRKSAGYDDAIGTTVIGGHVSDRHDRPGALRRLSQAHRGQAVEVVSGRQQVRFSVVQKASFPRNARLPRRFFRTTGPHRLVLISCTDRVVYPNGRFHYTRYQVVVAKQVPPRRGR
ncbi:DUF7507 domain-containing protein [Nocardioides dongkuii]|uniref:DUF7507 domain-containing protein n=1 Tax=Nocardioides dongkuii TaxID=2760089 RepID=UPI0015FD3553|nr:sortase [Nocardioides dongkuii]